MPDDRNPIARFAFKVEIPGITEGAFLSVSPLESFSTVIETRRGPDSEGRKWPGPPRCTNIAMRRLYTGNHALWLWRKAVLDGTIDRRSGSVILFGDDRRSEVARFNFFEAWPCRRRIGPLDGSAEEPLVEEVEIAVEKIELAT
jgi:phage tail-like protein